MQQCLTHPEKNVIVASKKGECNVFLPQKGVK
jgi:hypothetical protein